MSADVANRVVRVRRGIDGLTNTSIILGLAFTAANVQQFAAGEAPPWSIEWTVAWLIEPMVSALLLAVVAAEQITSQYRVEVAASVSATKWGCFLATYLMNTWESWRDGTPSGVVLHSVPPVMVLLAAEVGPALRDALARAVEAAAESASVTPEGTPTEPDDDAPRQVPASGQSAGDGEVASKPLPAVEPAPEPEPPSVAPRPAPAVGTADTGDVDPRVVAIARRLAAGEELTGPDIAAEHDVSPRTGRRLLGDARAHRDQHAPLHIVRKETTA